MSATVMSTTLLSATLKIPRIFLCFLLLMLAAAPSSAQQGSATVVRVFRLHYAEAADISSAVQALLSEDGSITIQPGKNRITINDRPNNMKRIAKVVAGMDVRPEHFRVHVVLLHGAPKTSQTEKPYSAAPRLQKMFPFDNYYELGQADLIGQIGDTLTLNLGENYRLTLTAFNFRQKDLPFGVSAGLLRLDLRPVILQRISEKAPAHQILKTRIQLSDNQEVSIGAGDSESASEGLVLILKALPAEKN